MLIALAFALIGAGVVLFVFISNKPRGGATGGPIAVEGGRGAGVGAMPSDVGEATDITAVGGTTDARFQIADKNDASRVAVELVFAKLDPMGGGVYQTTEPRAWIHMKDGRTVYISADRGRIRRPPGGGAGAAPESGEFTGNGRVLVFPPAEPGAAAGRVGIDVDTDEPGMIGRFETASFDTVLLEISSQDPWTVESEHFWAAGRGFVVRANQVLERLEFAKINAGGTIRYRATRSPAGSTQAAPDESELVGPPAPPPVAVATEDDELPLDDAGEPGPDDVAGAIRPGDADFIGPLGAPLSASKKEDLYLAEFRTDVRLTQQRRLLTADLLSVWTRFVDNKLPDGALGLPKDDVGRAGRLSGLTLPATTTTMPVPAQIASLVLGAMREPPSAERRLFNQSDDDVVLTWTGGMVARPLTAGVPGPDGDAARATPAELERGNHVFARFTAEPAVEGGRGGGRVVLTDVETGAAGICASLSYAATLRELTLAADAPGGGGCERVDFTMPGAGRFVGREAIVDLDTGVCTVLGGGTISRLPDIEDPELVTVRPEFPPLADPDVPLPPEDQPRIAWTRAAEFRFRLRDGRMTEALRSARFEGGVGACDDGSWLGGESLLAVFAERKGRGMALARVVIRGGNDGSSPALAVGRDTDSATDAVAVLPRRTSFMTANEIDVRFAPSRVRRGEDDATRTIATGRIVVGDQRSRLSADWLDARLVRTVRGDYEAGDVQARGAVRVDLNPGGATGGERVVATAQQMRADGQQRWVDFIGSDTEAVELVRGASVVAGPQMHLQESDGSLQVFGPGRVRHLELSRDASESANLPAELSPAVLSAKPESRDLPPGVTRLDVSWSRSMTYVDRTGRVECHGDATVSSLTCDGGQVARAERMMLDITPAPPPESAGGAVAGGTPAAGPLGDRRLLRAEALGSVLERDGGTPASVKSWTFGPEAPAAAFPSDLAGPPSPPPPREYQQVLSIEGPKIIVDEIAGMMTIPDAGRGVTLDAGGGADPIGGVPSEGGRSQFKWAGSMDFNRLTGELRMRRGVELRHLPLDSTELVTLTCDDLTAMFDMARGRGDAGSVGTGSGGGAKLRAAEAVGTVFAQSGTRHLTADAMSFDATSSVATAKSSSEDPVVMQDTAQAGGAPLIARSLRWHMRTDRVEVTEAMPVTGAMTR